MTLNGNVVRMEICSTLEMLEFVQLVSDRVGQIAGLDEDATHWIGVAVRESVINSIKHGHNFDVSKRVVVEFAFQPATRPTELVIRVLDQGVGFEPDDVDDPLAPENLLKAGGRGIFFMRSLMDEVDIRRVPEGGMEVRMVKKLSG